MSGCARLHALHVGNGRLRLSLVAAGAVHVVDLPATPAEIATLRHLHGPRAECPGPAPSTLALLRRLADEVGLALCRVVVRPGLSPQAWLRVGNRDDWHDLPLDVTSVALLLATGELPIAVEEPDPVDWDGALRTLTGEG